MKTTFTGRLARASATRPWLTVTVWVGVLAVMGYFAGSLGDHVVQDDSVLIAFDPETADELDAKYHQGDAVVTTENIVVTGEQARFGDAAFHDHLATLADAARTVDGVATVDVPTSTRGAVSADGSTALITITLADGDEDSQSVVVEDLKSAIADAGSDGFRDALWGELSVGNEFDELASQTLAQGEGIGIAVALVILAVVFGALMAAAVPVVVALVSIMTAMGLTAIVSRAFELSFFTLNMITMMGLALGIDYSLVAVQRFREELRSGRDVLSAVTTTGATANRAIAVSGITVLISLVGLLVVPSTIMISLGTGAILVAIASMLSALTLLPAILRLLGSRVGAGRLRSRTASAREPRMWPAIAAQVLRRPAVAVAVGAAVLVTLAVPALSMRQAFAGLEALPETNHVRVTSEIIADGFGVSQDRTFVVVEGASGTDSGIVALADAIEADPAFGDTTIDDAGGAVFINTFDVYATSQPQASDALDRLRDELIPAHLGEHSGAVVGGQLAFSHDFADLTGRYFPLVLASVLGASFLLLMIMFRSVVVPATTIVVNLLSTAAAYGALVAVFQWGWGVDLLGFTQVDAIAPWLPLFLFAVLFGLSMDYHVFLLSRIKEDYDKHGDTRRAVVKGLSSTGALITGAALIMLAVFGGFASGDVPDLTQMGFGLAIAIVLDATVVRVLLVPATMAVLGKANWYLPRWLGWLPAVTIEAPAQATPTSSKQEPEPALL